jgi:hypothetical protein
MKTERKGVGAAARVGICVRVGGGAAGVIMLACIARVGVKLVGLG